ncbi:Hypothetical predicted protein, partial [Pelobates cultripes]
EAKRPSLAQSQADSGSESEGSEYETNHTVPLTKVNLRKMLRETSEDIKVYTTAALENQITGLKEDMEALGSRTSHTERMITETQAKVANQDQDLETLKERVMYLEDGLEDLNNRSQRQNIRIRGLPESVLPEALLPTIRAIFQSLLPDIPEQEL